MSEEPQDIDGALPFSGDDARALRIIWGAVERHFDGLQQETVGEDQMAEENHKKEARVRAALAMGARLSFKSALDIQTSIPGPERAQGLYERNRKSYRAPEIASAMLQAFDGDDTSLSILRADIAENGALIEGLSLKTIEDRIPQRSRWVIAEASGIHPDPDAPSGSERVIAADCQCLLPADRKGAKRVVPMLDRRKRPRPDIIYEPDLYDRIRRADPSTIGYIDQMCVEPEFAHLKLAAAARYAALTRIIQMSRKNSIDHMIGVAFSIQGLSFPKTGDKFYLHTFDQRSISNIISLIVNAESTRCPATIVGRMQDTKVPVEFSYNGQHCAADLLTDWYYLDHQMDHVRR